MTRAAGPDERFVRSARRWMRAYPPRWRRARGDELLAVLADLAGPDARRLGPRAGLDLVRGGLATRWREHPPLGTWLLYRLADRPIPPAYRRWAADDIAGAFYPVREALLAGALAVLLSSVIVRQQDDPGPWVVVLGFVVVTGVIVPGSRRAQARHRHLVPRPGEPLVPGVLVAQPGPQVRVEARSALRWALPVLLTCAAAALVSSAVAPKLVRVVPDPADGAAVLVVVAPAGDTRWGLAALAAALTIGVVAAERTRRGLPGLLATRLEQPHRVLRAVTPADVARLTWTCALVVATGWAEATGRLVLGPTVVVGCVAFALLPGVLVARRRVLALAPGDTRDLAARDVWWMATRARRPSVDPPVVALRPLAGEVPAGLVVPPRPLGEPRYPVLP